MLSFSMHIKFNRVDKQYLRKLYLSFSQTNILIRSSANICSDWVRHGFINKVMTTWLELLEGKGNYTFF